MDNTILDNDLQMSGEITPKYAGFWIRVGATLVDFLVLIPLYGFMVYNMYSIKSPIFLTVLLIISALYKPFMEYNYGATLGKMAVKIRVTSHSYQNISVGQAVVLYLPWIFSIIISIMAYIKLFQTEAFYEAGSFFEVSQVQSQLMSPVPNYITSTFMIISCIVVAFNSTKQGLHDLVAKTYCIYT